jgi:hypothetical protein
MNEQNSLFMSEKRNAAVIAAIRILVDDVMHTRQKQIDQRIEGLHSIIREQADKIAGINHDLQELDWDGLKNLDGLVQAKVDHRLAAIAKDVGDLQDDWDNQPEQVQEIVKKELAKQLAPVAAKVVGLEASVGNLKGHVDYELLALRDEYRNLSWAQEAIKGNQPEDRSGVKTKPTIEAQPEAQFHADIHNQREDVHCALDRLYCGILGTSTTTVEWYEGIAWDAMTELVAVLNARRA